MKLLFMLPLVVQFIPPIIAAAIFLTACIAFYRKKMAGKTICLVGPPFSGKTTFLKWLAVGKFVPSEDRTAEREAVSVHDIMIDGKKTSIRTVIDTPGHLEVGGGNIFRQEIEKNDNILFFFNVKDFLENTICFKESGESYHFRDDDVFPRFEVLRKRIKEKGTPRKLLFIGTHFDELKGERTEKEVSIKIKSHLEGTRFAFLLSDYPLLICNLQEKKDYYKILKAFSNE